jgi:chromosome segregation ATPase
MAGIEQDFETVHRYIRGLDVDDADNNVSLAADDALSRIEAFWRKVTSEAEYERLCGVDAQRDALKAELRQAEEELAMGHGEACALVEDRKARAERDALKAENEFHKKALEEWNCKAEERLDTINALKAELDEAQGGHEMAADSVVKLRHELVKAERGRDALKAALEKIAELDEAWVVTDNVRGTHLVKLARQALKERLLS